MPNEGQIIVDNIDTKDKKNFTRLRKTVRNSISKPRKSNNI